MINKMRRRVLKFLLADIQFASRDLKEIAVLKEIGFEVAVLCIGNINESIINHSGIKIRKIEKLHLDFSQTKIHRAVKIIQRELLLIKVLRSYLVDCIRCHNLDALLIGWISTLFLFSKSKPLLVYDSHEYEVGRKTDGKRGKIGNYLTRILEKFLMKRCTFSIMVNKTIAEKVQTLHHLKSKPIVVPNAASNWPIDSEICKERRKEIIDTYGINKNAFLILYHGQITTGRGLENLIRAVANTPEVALVILGYEEGDYAMLLKKMILELDVERFVFFHQAVSNNMLWQYIGAFDVGMVMIENVCPSYYYSLPNKLFENIQSLTPIIGSNFPEIENIIEGYQIGLCCEPSDPIQISKAIGLMKSDKTKYAYYKTNLLKAKEELCWENQKNTLVESFSQIYKS